MKYIIITLLVILSGCCQPSTPIEVSLMAAKRHLPNLRRYYQNDPDLFPVLKDAYITSLDQWMKVLYKHGGKHE